ncbi:AraC family transcriptional regulator [Listeria booriae]|uniref:AraC family transcriptional regulator n=1 Tax=Listeria booriae TaxID=1552123 RepID=UPI00164CE524|nr:AraC family transcriptional regulator [Listeria booriae]MBC6129357.1 AraC family transcriptional regulator [Listeria booriae]
MFNSIGTFQTEQILSEELSLFECGFEDVRPRVPYQYEQIDYYLIHFIVEGEGMFFINGEIHQLGQGEGFVIPPNTDNNYYPLVGNPWSYRWIGIKGSCCDKILRAAGLLQNIFIYQHDDISKMNRLFQEVYLMSQENQLYGAIGKVYEIMNELITEYNNKKRYTVSEGESYILAAMNIIKANYSDPKLSIADIAETIQIERSYLFKLFKKYITTSPQQYLILFRLNKATELLRKTNLSIEEIAFLTGFSGYSHFSKTFQSKKNIPPTQFRKQYRVID